MNDLKYKMLGDLGYSGSLDDRRFSFYKANGAVSNDINDAEFEWLRGLGFTQTSIRDRWNAYLNTVGFGNEKSEHAVAKADNLYFSPRNMFLAGEKGVWYDPSDLSTLFQDAAGTTPVTAVGQPVGLMLDKSKGLVLGPELVTNGGFASATGWTVGVNWSIGGGVATHTAGAQGFLDTLGPSDFTTGTYYVVRATVTVTAGQADIYIKGGLVASVTSSGTYSWTRPAGSSSVTGFRVDGNTGFTGSVDNISVRELPGNHATQSTATSRPILGLENGKYFLAFDGIDDWLATASIDFTTTDKMTVVAGVRKLSDAAVGEIVELSATVGNAGTFGIKSPGGVGVAEYAFDVNGTALSGFSARTFAAPVTNVLSCLIDLSGVDRASEVFPRVNGGIPTLVGVGAASAGTGNFGNYPLYIGRRGGTSLPFNGRLYGLVVRGVQSSNLFIDYAERYLNRRTGAY